MLKTRSNTLGGTVSLFTVFPKNKREGTDGIVLNAINELLEEQLTEDYIERTHRIGKPKQNKKTPRPIIIKFYSAIVDGEFF